MMADTTEISSAESLSPITVTPEVSLKRSVVPIVNKKGRPPNRSGIKRRPNQSAETKETEPTKMVTDGPAKPVSQADLGSEMVKEKQVALSPNGTKGSSKPMHSKSNNPPHSQRKRRKMFLNNFRQLPIHRTLQKCSAPMVTDGPAKPVSQADLGSEMVKEKQVALSPNGTKGFSKPMPKSNNPPFSQRTLQKCSAPMVAASSASSAKPPQACLGYKVMEESPNWYRLKLPLELHGKTCEPSNTPIELSTYQAEAISNNHQPVTPSRMQPDQHLSLDKDLIPVAADVDLSYDNSMSPTTLTPIVGLHEAIDSSALHISIGSSKQILDKAVSPPLLQTQRIETPTPAVELSILSEARAQQCKEEREFAREKFQKEMHLLHLKEETEVIKRNNELLKKTVLQAQLDFYRSQLRNVREHQN